MTAVEASAVVPLTQEAAWDFLFADPRRAAEHLDEVVAIEDYEVRADGTPRYRMVRRFGPLPPVSMVSDYTVFERPHRAVNRVLESPLGGVFTVTYEPVPEGTRMRWSWAVEPRSRVLGLLLPLLRPLMRRSLQRDVRTVAQAAAGARGRQ
jgi:hypothetical protein